MANEKRLTDANEIEELFYKQVAWGATDLMDAFDDALQDAQTVDAVEVVHARWIWSEENECWICSNCEMSALNNYRGNSTESNYCPNCGAKMDGGNEDGSM